MSTNDLASCGTPDQFKGGEMLAPSQVYFAGMFPPSLNAELDSAIELLAEGWNIPCSPLGGRVHDARTPQPRQAASHKTRRFIDSSGTASRARES
jgi:hypothetical protein